MPKYKVDVTGPGNAADVTHLTVDTDIANGSVKTLSIAANGNKARRNAVSTQRAKNAETLTKGESLVTNQALANKATARRQLNMTARAPPAPSNFALRPAAPQSIPRLAPGSRLPPINSQAVLPKLQPFPKAPAWNPPEQTLPPPPQTRSSRSTLLTGRNGRNGQLGKMAKVANVNEEESNVMMPKPSARPANDDEFPEIEGGRTYRKQRKHTKQNRQRKQSTRKHGKKSNKSKKRK